MKLLFQFTLAFALSFSFSCNLHYFSIANHGTKNSEVYENLQQGKLRFNLIRKAESGKTNLYNSSALEYELSKSKLFKLSQTTKIDLTYTSSSGVNGAGISTILFLLTLGIFPSLEESHSWVTFTLSNRDDKKLIRDYTYPIKGRRINSWLTIPFYLILPIFSKSFDGGIEYNTSSASIRLLVDAFETDFANDCKENPELLEKLQYLSREMIEL
ncbi:hypothetical protein EHR01_00785 [Leptospira mtsangambouensis]|uniref:Lipoprotein n=1 Tax=Leptospira mtsangambouensis TaxID=2484912 RepID=A0ABY2P219_9LEPT|nr:hypothetical protein [Leptospira mtsangambouensis]TGM81373.1 hypothetical protein EHR01_00785 [Leptospira mtsangambouensis]